MKITRQRGIIIFGGIILVIVLFVVFNFSLRSSNAPTQFNLTIWGTDDPKSMANVFAAYTGTQSGNSISYVQIDPANYKNKLLAALAAGTGPDIFEVGNRDLPQWQNLVAPLPSTLASTFNLTALEQNFPTVVEQDFVRNRQIYGLPLTIDTLALIYNKDLFDSAGIVSPPATWEEFQNDVVKLRSINGEHQIVRAGAAIGGSKTSIPQATDILSLLMLQNGAQMTAPDQSAATFAGDDATNGTSPGVNAFNFYLQFANAASPYYTWNDGMGDALQDFAQGKVGMLFGYTSMLADIRAKAPFLNIGVAPMPQPADATIKVNYPKYTAFVAAKNGNFQSAWQFLISLTTSGANESIYAEQIGGFPALRSLIGAGLTDPASLVYANQVLTARSWYEADDAKISDIISAAIQSVLNGSSDSSRALLQAQASVTALMNQ